MINFSLICLQLLVSLFVTTSTPEEPTEEEETLLVKKCIDFELTGKGTDKQWENVPWTNMPPLGKVEEKYETKFKMMYSRTGIYVLAYCQDKMISTEYDQDQGDIWNGDVFEVFLQTDPDNPLYFEYEINALNAELVILVPNNEGDFFGWSPWHYEGERKVKKTVFIESGESKPGSSLDAWYAEFFFPYALFKALKNVPPPMGSVWKGNFYRMDYDTGERARWAWKPVESTFHEYKSFGTIQFE